MDAANFDRLARTLSRRGTLSGLLAGLSVPLLPGVATRAKKKKKTCPTGQLTCKIKKGKSKKKICVDGQSDANCGACGNVCTLPQTCGGGSKPGVCGCTPTTCEAEGKNCDSIPDGCGGTLNCGTCEDAVCGGGGMPNVCSCLATGVVTESENRHACCDGDCCFDSPGFCKCAGGCG
jgi:hypothetical protein